MTTPISLQRSRHLRRETATHRFSVGQAVRLKGSFGRPALPSDVYKITGMLPSQGNSPQYRIRNDGERHERVTTQDSLEPVGISRPDEDETLMERTFGHGQGTETQQSRNPKAEAAEGSAQA